MYKVGYNNFLNKKKIILNLKKCILNWGSWEYSDFNTSNRSPHNPRYEGHRNSTFFRETAEQWLPLLCFLILLHKTFNRIFSKCDTMIFLRPLKIGLTVSSKKNHRNAHYFTWTNPTPTLNQLSFIKFNGFGIELNTFLKNFQ